jgi:hypothetical protein
MLVKGVAEENDVFMTALMLVLVVLLEWDRRCARRERWDHPYPAYSEILTSGYKQCCYRPSSRALEVQSWCDDRQGERKMAALNAACTRADV